MGSHGKENLESGALVDLAVSFYKTVMVLCHFSYNGKANTCSPVFRIAMKAGEYIENAVGIFLFKADALVCNIDLAIFFLLLFTGQYKTCFLPPYA